MNKVFLIGRLCSAPEMRQTNSGKSVCNMRIAVNRRGTDEADFFNVTAWGVVGENCGKYLDKGKQVAVDGSIQIRQYEDNNGNTRYATEIIAQNVEFLTPKNSGETAPVDEIPF